MGEMQEAAVRALLDSYVAFDRDAIAEHYAENATLSVVASREPLVGRDAIRKDLDRQAGVYTDFRHTIINMASSDSVVFVERIDTVNMGNRDVVIHATGVFEVDDNGEITAWRDYLDMKEIEAQLA
jgi:limonene-1,2-epoxide hydrolase